MLVGGLVRQSVGWSVMFVKKCPLEYCKVKKPTFLPTSETGVTVVTFATVVTVVSVVTVVTVVTVITVVTVVTKNCVTKIVRLKLCDKKFVTKIL